MARWSWQPARKYTLVVSRGMEYDRFEAEVELVAGQTVSVLAG